MKGTVRIIAGTMRGRSIPFKNSRYDDADITPQKVKGALFSILGENLHGKVFIDLYSGSGQIGFEALSRGADRVILNESDRSRYSFIREFSQNLEQHEKMLVLNMKAAEAVSLIAGRGIKADFIFIDPPYEKVKGETSAYNDILSRISESGVLINDGVVVVQHFSSNRLNERCARLECVSVKKYGTTSLSIYNYNRGSSTPSA